MRLWWSMEIGVNGATTYIETSGFSEDGFGWNLPNGIKIYFKQVFIDEETSTVNPGTAIRTETDANGKTVTIQGTDGTTYVKGNSSYTITVNSYEN